MTLLTKKRPEVDIGRIVLYLLLLAAVSITVGYDLPGIGSILMLLYFCSKRFLYKHRKNEQVKKIEFFCWAIPLLIIVDLFVGVYYAIAFVFICVIFFINYYENQK